MSPGLTRSRCTRIWCKVDFVLSCCNDSAANKNPLSHKSVGPDHVTQIQLQVTLLQTLGWLYLHFGNTVKSLILTHNWKPAESIFPFFGVTFYSHAKHFYSESLECRVKLKITNTPISIHERQQFLLHINGPAAELENRLTCLILSREAKTHPSRNCRLSRVQLRHIPARSGIFEFQLSTLCCTSNVCQTGLWHGINQHWLQSNTTKKIPCIPKQLVFKKHLRIADALSLIILRVCH